MVALYVSSFERYTGKDLITMGLISRLMRDGFKVGFFKPLGHLPFTVMDTVTDKGAWFIHELFELQDPIELICPIVITQDLMRENYKHGVEGLRKRITDAYNEVSKDKDIIIISCDNNFSEGSSFGLSGTYLINLLKAHALFVETYEGDFSIDLLLELQRVIGTPMLGVVFNKAEKHHVEEIEHLVSPFLNRKGLQVFGILPQDKVLGAIGVKDLAECLEAEVVCGKEELDGLVEKFLVGGMQVDKFISYMVKNPESAIIVGGDRTDIQLVAIEHGASCLVLTGKLYPNDTITDRAKEKGVPILVARNDTFTVAKTVETTVGSLSLENRKKIDHGIAVVKNCLHFDHLYKKLSLQ